MPVPDSLLLLAPGCPHCPVVLDGLTALVKEGRIGRLEVINIAVLPERARDLGVRSVPWVRLGDLEFLGQMTPEELRHWAEVAPRPDGRRLYLAHLLTTGQLARVEARAGADSGWLTDLAELLADPEAGLHVRIGVMAVLEQRHGRPLPAGAARALARAARDPDPRLRADACHALGLADRGQAAPVLRACLQDADPQVREAAREALHEP
jgi:hypothetical protein